MALHDMRKEYDKDELTEQSAERDPFAQFQHWFDAAAATNPGEWYEPNVMTLATVDEAGRPDARIVLLKAFDDAGFVFFTNYASDKGKQLADRPDATLVFHWANLERQVRVRGAVEKIPARESREYFQTRPRGSQLGALVSPQSEVITDRGELEQELAALEAKYEGADVPMPSDWGGYRVRPDRFEFWQGRPNRLHDRLRYTLDDKNWSIERLAP